MQIERRGGRGEGGGWVAGGTLIQTPFTGALHFVNTHSPAIKFIQIIDFKTLWIRSHIFPDKSSIWQNTMITQALAARIYSIFVFLSGPGSKRYDNVSGPGSSSRGMSSQVSTLSSFSMARFVFLSFFLFHPVVHFIQQTNKQDPQQLKVKQGLGSRFNFSPTPIQQTNKTLSSFSMARLELLGFHLFVWSISSPRQGW